MIDSGLSARNFWAELDGSSSCAVSASSVSLDDLPGSGDFTVEALFMVDTVAPVWNVICSKGSTSGSGAGWYLAAKYSNVEFYVHMDSVDADLLSATEIVPGTWYHVVGFFEASVPKVHLAINGVWESSVAGGGAGTPVTDAAYEFAIGRFADPASYYLYGGISWIGLYDADIYDGQGETSFTPVTAPPTDSIPSIVGGWLFNRKDAYVPDVAGNDDLTLFFTNPTWRRGWYSDPIDGSLTDLRDASQDPIFDIVLEQYLPSFTLHDDNGPMGEYNTFDAITCNDVLVRAWYHGPNEMKVQYMETEDSSDEQWYSPGSAVTLAATGISATVPPTLAVDGDTVRVFYWDAASGDIEYFENTAKGVGLAASWGSTQVVANVTNLVCLAATALTRVHYGYTTGSNNVRLGVATYSGSWSKTDSHIYWQSLPDTFDAISGPGRVTADLSSDDEQDFIYMSTHMPYIIKRTEVVRGGSTLTNREIETVEAIVVLRYQNGIWADHQAIDISDLDSVGTGAHNRGKLRVSKCGDYYVMAYSRHHGKPDYHQESIAITRSKDGWSWEHPYLYKKVINTPVVVCSRGKHVYLINSQYTWRSPECNYFAGAQTELELMSWLLSLGQSVGDMSRLTLTVGNPEGSLESESLIADDLALQARVGFGWWTGGEGLGVQTGIADVEFIGKRRSVPWNRLQIGARGIVGRLESVQADELYEWNSQQIAGDDFDALMADQYTGLRHTATMAGSLIASSSELQINSTDMALAWSTYLPDAWNGSIAAAFQVQSTPVADYAGLVFRAYDDENYMSVRYDQASDTLILYETRSGTDYTLYTSSARGWSTGTWYWLKVRFWYGAVWVYQSTDGITYSVAFSQEIEGNAEDDAWTWANFTSRELPFMSGRVGYIGRGYS